jgi:hypothetical protein
MKIHIMSHNDIFYEWTVFTLTYFANDRTQMEITWENSVTSSLCWYIKECKLFQYPLINQLSHKVLEDKCQTVRQWRTDYCAWGAGVAQWYSAWLQAVWSGVWLPAGAGSFSLHRVQTGSGVHPASYAMCPGRGGGSGRGVKLTTNLHLLPT